jgi:hypothetical protein
LDPVLRPVHRELIALLMLPFKIHILLPGPVLFAVQNVLGLLIGHASAAAPGVVSIVALWVIKPSGVEPSLPHV